MIGKARCGHYSVKSYAEAHSGLRAEEIRNFKQIYKQLMQLHRVLLPENLVMDNIKPVISV